MSRSTHRLRKTSHCNDYAKAHIPHKCDTGLCTVYVWLYVLAVTAASGRAVKWKLSLAPDTNHSTRPTHIYVPQYVYAEFVIDSIRRYQASADWLPAWLTNRPWRCVLDGLYRPLYHTIICLVYVHECVCMRIWACAMYARPQLLVYKYWPDCSLPCQWVP